MFKTKKNIHYCFILPRFDTKVGTSRGARSHCVNQTVARGKNVLKSLGVLGRVCTIGEAGCRPDHHRVTIIPLSVG